MDRYLTGAKRKTDVLTPGQKQDERKSDEASLALGFTVNAVRDEGIYLYFMFETR